MGFLMKKFEGKDFDLSAIIIPLQEIENVIQPIRSKMTIDGAKGLLPHITVLYPFYKDIELLKPDAEHIDLLCQKIKPFKISLTEFQRFADHGVLYLVPESQIEILNAIQAISKEYPQFPPYEGHIPIDKIIPHSTVAVAKDCRALDAIESQLLTEKKIVLPLDLEVKSFWLVVKSNNHWYQYKELKLGRDL